MGRLTRRGSVAAAVVAVALSLPGVASAALLVWSLSPTVVTATAGQINTITFTATNLDVLGRDLGCLEIDFPSTYTSISVQSIAASNGRAWTGSVVGTSVVVRSTDGGGRLEPPDLPEVAGDSVSFDVRMTPTAGAATWPNHAHQTQNCDDADEVGVPIAATVLPPLLPTPAPTPTAPPVTPTPRPTPTPIVSLPSPVPLPSASLPVLPPIVGTPLPSLAATRTPSPSVRPSATPTPSGSSPAQATLTPSPNAGAGAPPGDRPGPSGASVPASSDPGPRSVAVPPVRAAAPELNVAFEPAELELGLGSIGLLGGISTWAVPAATFAVPGLLLLLFVLLQAAGALAWIPAVRRLRGDDGDPGPA